MQVYEALWIVLNFNFLDFLAFINKEEERLRMMENFSPEYPQYLFDYLLLVLRAYMSSFMKDVNLDQKGESQTANVYSTIELFAKTLDENLDKFKINNAKYYSNLSKFYDLLEFDKSENFKSI
jgi:hypothetical protein